VGGLSRLLALLALVICGASLVLRLASPPGESEEDSTAGQEGRPAATAAADPTGFRERAARALAGPAFGTDSSDSFAENEGGGSVATKSPARSLHAPRNFRAEAQEGGLRLIWEPHPENPVGEKLYRLTRWTGDGAAELVAETSGLEHFDPVTCEGVSYHYRLQAMVRRQVLSGQEVMRKSPSAAASALLTRSTAWESPGLESGDRIFLEATRRGRPWKGPFGVAAGEEIGGTGWFLEELRLRETEVRVETRTPRFDALGRRVIIDGRPADRVREVSAIRILASVRLSDPCGSFWNLEMILPVGPEQDGG